MGFGKTRRDVKLLVETYTRSKGTLKGSEISNGWRQKFLKRNPSLRLRVGDATAGVRMDAVNVENITAYFDLLRNVFNEFRFDQRPERIYNMDETGVPLEPRPPEMEITVMVGTLFHPHTSTYSSQTHIVAWPPYTHFHTQIHSHTHTFSAIQFQMSRTVRVTVTTALLTVVEMTVMVSTVFHPCIQVLTCSYIHTVITFIHTFLPQIHTHNTHTHILCFFPRLWG